MMQFSDTQTTWEKWGANVAAATLLKDSLLNEVHEKLGKPKQGPEWIAWNRARTLVRSAIQGGVHEDLIRSRLAALYRQAPPPLIQTLWAANPEPEARQATSGGCAQQSNFDDTFDDSLGQKRKKPK